MAETMVLGLLILIPVAMAGGGPFFLRPMSQGPNPQFLRMFTLIDVACLVWLLSLVPLLLTGLLEILSLFASTLKFFTLHADTNDNWFLTVTNHRGPAILMLAIGLVLVAIWASGVRRLTAHGINNWKARASYLGLASPLAYLCPACVLLSLALIILDRRLIGLWGLILMLIL